MVEEFMCGIMVIIGMRMVIERMVIDFGVMVWMEGEVLGEMGWRDRVVMLKFFRMVMVMFRLKIRFFDWIF